MKWRKSSRSSGNGGACVEIAELDRLIAVRDSKNPDGARLTITRHAWTALLTQIRKGDHNL